MPEDLWSSGAEIIMVYIWDLILLVDYRLHLISCLGNDLIARNPHILHGTQHSFPKMGFDRNHCVNNNYYSMS